MRPCVALMAHCDTCCTQHAQRPSAQTQGQRASRACHRAPAAYIYFYSRRRAAGRLKSAACAPHRLRTLRAPHVTPPYTHALQQLWRWPSPAVAHPQNTVWTLQPRTATMPATPAVCMCWVSDTAHMHTAGVTSHTRRAPTVHTHTHPQPPPACPLDATLLMLSNSNQTGHPPAHLTPPVTQQLYKNKGKSNTRKATHPPT